MPWCCNQISGFPGEICGSIQGRLGHVTEGESESSDAELKAVMFSLVLSFCKAQVEIANRLWLREKDCLREVKHGVFFSVIPPGFDLKAYMN